VAEITRGSTQATFGVSWNRGVSGLDVSIRDPDGDEPEDAKTRRIRGDRPYSFEVVKGSPLKPGPWTVRVTGTDLRSARLRFFGFEVNRDVWLEAYPSRYRVDPGEEIAIRARLCVPYPAKGALVSAWIGLPGQDWTHLRLDEGIAPGHGGGTPVYRARFTTPPQIRGTYMVAVDAFVKNESKFLAGSEKIEIRVPRTRRRVLFSFVADERVSSRALPVRGMNTRRAWWHPHQDLLLRQWQERHQD